MTPRNSTPHEEREKHPSASNDHGRDDHTLRDDHPRDHIAWAHVSHQDQSQERHQQPRPDKS